VIIGLLTSVSTKEAPVSEDYDGRQFVGIDLHRRRSVLVRMTEAGETLEWVRIWNDPDQLAAVMSRAGEHPEVVLEATYGWYWAADLLAGLGSQVHLAHPLGVKGFAYRRVKNDVRDATDLADLLRMGRLPEAWIAPPATRELRELVRHRAKLVHLRTSLRCQVHAVLAGQGVTISVSDLFGATGIKLLNQLRLVPAYQHRVESLRRLIEAFDVEIDTVTKITSAQLRQDLGYAAVQTIPGVGPVFAALFVAEIGEVSRFPGPAQLASWAGLTPKHYESDTTVHRGRITKQGSRLVRWAAVEAVQRLSSHTRLGAYRDRVAARRGRNIATVAAARELVELVYYALRDHTVRRLAPRTAA
jgi:transposase